MFGLSFVEAHGGGRDGVSHWPGNIVAFREDLVAFSQGIVREKGRGLDKFVASNLQLLHGLRDLKFSTFHGFQEHRSWCKSPLALPRALRKP